MMASIRLFGRGKSAAGAGGGTALSAAQIAEVLDGLRTASMSTTWRCRHGSGTAIGEGAVDFESRRSRATVIRGKSAFEYVRIGSSVYRAAVPDEEVREQLGGGRSTAASTSAAARLSAPVEAGDDGVDEDEDVEEEIDELDDADADETGIEAGGGPEQDGEDADAAVEAEAEADLLGTSEDEPGADGAGDEGEAEEAVRKDGDEPVRAWQTFSENDACGVHAYAEPAVLAAGVRAAGAVTAAGRKEIDGVLLAGYTVTLKPKPADPDRLLARLARQLRDHGANSLTVTAFVDEGDGAAGAVPDFSGTGAHGGGESGGAPRIVRLRLELAHWTPADDPTADHTVSVDLFEFGEPAQVERPAAGSVTRRTTRSCADLALF